MLSTKQAGDLLQLSPVSIRSFIARGIITAQKVGRDYLISHEELERFQQERRKPGNPDRGKGSRKARKEGIIKTPKERES